MEWYVNRDREPVDLTTIRDASGRASETVWCIEAVGDALVRTVWVRRGAILSAASVAEALADAAPGPPPGEPGMIDEPDAWTGTNTPRVVTPEALGVVTPYSATEGRPVMGRKGPPGDKGPVGDRGPRGAAGEAGVTKPFVYEMPVATTTATFDHPLGHDPVAVQVLVDGAVCDEFSVTFPVPGEQVRVGFDVNVRAVIRVI